MLLSVYVMNLRDLKYLTAVAKYNHFGKAAKACFVSQPALSMQIKRLEFNLGIKIFERTNKSVRLTEEGKLLVEHAKIILENAEQISLIAKSRTNPFSGELKLGIIPTIAPYLLPHIFPTLKKEFPDLAIYLIEEQTHILLAKLQTGDIDAALLALPTRQLNVNERILFEDEFYLGVCNQHPLVKKKTIKPADIKGINLLLLEEGHCLSEQVLTFCDENNIHAVHEFKATSLETLRYMVAANLGVTLMPRLAHRSNDGVTYLRINVKPKPQRTIGVVWRNSTTKTILLEALVEMITKASSQTSKNFPSEEG